MCTTGNATESCRNYKTMDYASLDPYEQQLLKVFNSYDCENRGSLDEESLTQLCCTLQLEEQGLELVQQLINEVTRKTRVTFIEFKDALLVLLGNVQNKHKINNELEQGSPDREVSPKFVYGAKKYGRRSRPKIDEDVFNENTNYSNHINYNIEVQRSSSQSDVLQSKKRKTNTKLKRCTSFPGSHNYNTKTNEDVFLSNSINTDQEFVCTEEMLRKAWEKLGVGEDGHLNQTELILVCDAIGLHKLAKSVIRQLSNKLELDEGHKISFQELLEVLQQDDTWSEVLSPNVADTTITSINCLSNSVFPYPKMIQHITLGPDGTGFINADVIMEMWETVGISSPKLLLQGLGFVSTPVCVAELASALEKEIKTIQETKNEISNPYIALLQAILALYRSEIRCLKTILEQMHAERDKLKSDVVEANNRATLLAQEVDDNHTRMEQNTQNQVKLLEQKHSDIIKELTQQLSIEKDQLTHLNRNLEERILNLETDENKLQNDILVAQEYSATIEKENHILNMQLSELQQLKEVLTEQVAILENEKQVYELENQQAKIEPLLKKLSELQIENSHLRDKNDEMLTEIEGLNNQISVMRTKVSSTPTFHTLDQSMEENISIICEGMSLGSKRRSDDSPSKDLNVLCLMGNGSPRLGKFRKYQKAKCDYLDIPVASSESGFDTELDALDSSLSVSVNDSEEIGHLQAKIAHLENILKQNSIPIPLNNLSLETEDTTLKMKIKQLTQRSIDLQSVIASVQLDLSKTLDGGKLCECESASLVKSINQKFILLCNDKENVENQDIDLKAVDLNVENQIQKYVKENQELVVKCAELESCIELLRSEYEKCEDYWSSKLDEERLMFEQEQTQSSEKLTELIGKMAEYELQFNSQDVGDYSRLPPIEEAFSLEKQFTDLELEYDEYKEQTEFQLAEKANELAELKEKLIVSRQKTTFDKEIQVDFDNRFSNLSNCLVESTNLFSADAMPFGWCKNRTEIQPNSLDALSNNIGIEKRDFVNPVFAWNKTDQSTNVSNEEVLFNIPNQSTVPTTSSESTSTITDNNIMPIRPKRTRKHDNSYHKVQKLSSKKDQKEENANKNNQTSFRLKNRDDNSRVSHDVHIVKVPIGALHNLNGRMHHLEQRCRHLQIALKQQHYHAERMLQHCWQQYRGEKAELQYMLKSSQEKLEHQMRICNEQLERLARTDILVKDLYVENSYLVANVQRLEKQCHILTQYNSSSSSV